MQDSASYGDSMAGRLQDAVVEDYSHCSTDEIADVGIADHLQITSVQHCSQFPADEVVDNITSSLFASDPREREIGSVNTDPPVDGVRRSLVSTAIFVNVRSTLSCYTLVIRCPTSSRFLILSMTRIYRWYINLQSAIQPRPLSWMIMYMTAKAMIQ